jgi:Golgi phosphoprotein 3
LKHLTLADEIVVLMLRDDSGAIRPECATVASMAIAGGILMELALLSRIDTDLKTLFIVDPTPVGDDLLDEALHKIAAAPQSRSSAWWIRALGLHGGDLSVRVLGRLVEAGILRTEDRQFLWVFSRRAYPQNTGREEREAKARLLSVIFNDDVPEARDTLLLGLADSTGVLDTIVSAEDRRKAASRIAQVIALEEINRSVSRRSSRSRRSIARSAAPRHVGAPRFDTGWRMRIGTAIDDR